MPVEPKPEEVIKAALTEIYNLRRIDGLIVIGIVSEKGTYSMKGRVMGSPTNRMRMFAQTIHKTASEFGIEPEDLIDLLKGLIAETRMINKPKAKPTGGSPGTSFTITKM
jgi:hypothetical protein